MDKIILYLENDEEYRNLLSELLRRHGYRVIEAGTIEAARAALEQHFVHLILVDIRMVDDDDPNDVSGLDFAQETDYERLPKIIITSYPSFESVRAAMTPTASGSAPVIKFMAKDEGPRAMLEAIDAAFDQHVPIEWDLQVDYEMPLSRDALAARIAGLSPELTSAEIGIEIDDLMRTVYRDCSQVTVSRIVGQGQGCLWLEVVAYPKQGAPTHALLVIGSNAAVAREERGYTTHVPSAAANGAYHVADATTAWRLSAKTYRPVGVAPEALDPLRHRFSRFSADKLAVTLARLYSQTLRAWHEQEQAACPGPQLIHAYGCWLGLGEEDLAATGLHAQLQAVARELTRSTPLRADVAEGAITVSGNGEHRVHLADPAGWLAKSGLAWPSLSGVSHGAVGLDTVLLTEQGQAWLIGHGAAGIGPLLRDYLLLEAEILCELLGDLSLEERHGLTTALYTVASLAEEDWPKRLDTVLSTSSARTATAAIRTIRAHAAKQVGPEAEPYLVGLWCCYLKRVLAYDNSLRHSARQMLPLLQSVMSMSVISQRLSPPTLVIDHVNRRVLVNDRSEELTPQEYTLLCYLYEHRNQACSRRDITIQGLGEPYDSNQGDDDRVNTAIKRLRETIEDDPQSPIFIETVRGYGYRLNIAEK